jgi:hypothetical protein
MFEVAGKSRFHLRAAGHQALVEKSWDSQGGLLGDGQRQSIGQPALPLPMIII